MTPSQTYDAAANLLPLCRGTKLGKEVARIMLESLREIYRDRIKREMELRAKWVTQ